VAVGRPSSISGFDHHVFVESSKDFKAGMEGKDMFNRYKHALDYLNKAKETHQRIMVRTCRTVCAR